MKKILFIDDEQNILDSLKRSLSHHKKWLTLFFAIDYKQGKSILETEDINIVVADYKMPDRDGLSILKEVKENYPDIKRVLLTGSPEVEIFEKTDNIIDHLLSKPSNSKEITELLKKL